MSYNWNITVGNPILEEDMSFMVKYKKKSDSVWIDFLPNPTSNNFTITVDENEEYDGEIRTVCSDGTVSAPIYFSTSKDNQPQQNVTYEVLFNKYTDNYIKYENGENGYFSLNLKLNDDSDTNKYTAKITSTSGDKGFFILNGMNFLYDQEFTIIPGLNSLEYHPTEYGNGEHHFKIDIKDSNGNSPKSPLIEDYFYIYRKITPVYVKAYFELKQLRNGTVFRKSRWNMKSKIDFKYVSTTYLTNLKIVGTRRGNPFEENVNLDNINNQNKEAYGVLIDETNYNYGEDPHKEGDEITLIFTDQSGNVSEIKTNFIKQ